MNITTAEIETQPRMWQEAVALLPSVEARLPGPGARVAILGCGTSYFIAQAAAILRESKGLGETDALIASEATSARTYDAVIAITRSGTTTEVLQALRMFGSRQPTLAISGTPGSPVLDEVDDAILLDFADEVSVVQTRFATTCLALLRAHLGDDLQPAVREAQASLSSALPIDPAEFEHFVFLGRGWSVAIASEAALKFREAARTWTESYAQMEYRHGPISVAGPRSLVWFVGGGDAALAADIRATGATVIARPGDAMAELVTIQRAAVSLAHARGLDPDQPLHLTRSVTLN
jgi:CRISPR-associated protein Cas5a/b/c